MSNVLPRTLRFLGSVRKRCRAYILAYFQTIKQLADEASNDRFEILRGVAIRSDNFEHYLQ